MLPAGSAVIYPAERSVNVSSGELVMKRCKCGGETAANRS